MTSVENPERAGEKSSAPATQEQTRTSDLDIRQMLEQQISQAIQPVVEEFRQQMAQELAQQRTAARDALDIDTEKGNASASAEAPAPKAAASKGQKPPHDAKTQLTQTVSPAGSALQTATQHPVSETLRRELGQVGQQMGPVLQSALVGVLTATLSEAMHTAIQQQAEQGLHTLLQNLFKMVPDDMNGQEMAAKTEQMLQVILREFLGTIFAEAIRTTVTQKSEQTIQASLHGDFGEAGRNTADMLKTITEALIATLRRNQGNLVRLALALALLALAGSMAQSGANKDTEKEKEKEKQDTKE
jgi:hypothetical protein